MKARSISQAFDTREGLIYFWSKAAQNCAALFSSGFAFSFLLDIRYNFKQESL